METRPAFCYLIKRRGSGGILSELCFNSKLNQRAIIRQKLAVTYVAERFRIVNVPPLKPVIKRTLAESRETTRTVKLNDFDG